MYTFDDSEERALETYELICNTYKQIFRELNMPIIKGNVNYYFKF